MDNDDLPYFRDVSDSETVASPGGRARRPATETLAAFALDEAIPVDVRRRLRRAGSFALLVEVPSSEWVEPVRAACDGLRGWTLAFARSGSARFDDRPDKGVDRVAESLARGGLVLGVSQSPERFLPSALVASADARVRVGAPSDAVIARVVRAATGRSPADLPPRTAAGLSYSEICAAVRVGSSARACVERLVATTKAKLAADDAVADATPFEDLRGYGNSHSWGMRLLGDLEAWRRGEVHFNDIDRNVVLASKPGLGKSSYVRSLARTARLPLVASSVSSWFTSSNGYLDGVLKSIDLTFEQAMSIAPSILFLDECEAIPDRATLSDRAREWWTPVVTHILLKIDTIASNTSINICIIGATNYADRLDAALVRPGRLDRIIRIEPPGAADLAAIFRQHLGDDLPNLDLAPLGQLALGASGAEVVGFVRRARGAARAAGRPLRSEDLVDAVAPEDARAPGDLRRTAVHEVAHAVGIESLGTGRVRRVDVLARGGNGGLTNVSSRLSHLPLRGEVERYVVSLLTGRAGEVVLLGEACGGAGGSRGSDLALATTALAGLHGSHGLGGTLAYLGSPEIVSDSLRRDPELRAAVEADLRRLHAEAERLVGDHRDVILVLVERLLARRVITGDEVRAALAEAKPAAEARIGGVL